MDSLYPGYNIVKLKFWDCRVVSGIGLLWFSHCIMHGEGERDLMVTLQIGKIQGRDSEIIDC